MDPRIAPLAATVELNTMLMLNCLDGVTEEQARHQVAPGANHVAFLATHLVQSRHFLLGALGVTMDDAMAPFVGNAKRQDEVARFPTLDQVRAAWHEVSARLQEVLSGLDASRLDAPSAMRFPISDKSTVGVIAFLCQHDAYHVGQLSFLRRCMGLPAMSYKAAASAP